jgi:hypothetical protein
MSLESHLEHRIDKNVQKYWRHIHEHITAATCRLAEQGMAFRRVTEDFGSPHNTNFLGLAELNARLDLLSVNKIKHYGSSRFEKPSYLLKNYVMMSSNLKLKGKRTCFG